MKKYGIVAFGMVIALVIAVIVCFIVEIKRDASASAVTQKSNTK